MELLHHGLKKKLITVTYAYQFFDMVYRKSNIFTVRSSRKKVCPQILFVYNSVFILILPSRLLQWTHQTLPSFRLQLVQTDVPLQEQRIYGACSPRSSLQLCRLPLPTYSGLLQQKYQHTCNPKLNSFHHETGRLLYRQGVSSI